VIGEVHGDAALCVNLRRQYLPDAGFAGSANLLVMLSLDAANILFSVLKAGLAKA